MNKIIFLDIDGVLNVSNYQYNQFKQNLKYRDKNGYIFDPECVLRLNEITDLTGAKIVISSSWRSLGINKLREVFKDRGITGEIIDCTPIGTIDNLYLCRGEEIEDWIIKNGYPDKVAVLDDQSLGQNYNWKYFFKTNAKTGITEEIKNRVIEHLND